ncbi:hypothetical protein M3P19_07485 [Muricauda sp. 2012CJ35-5]|uniref:Uncharacterized protein n=1 Tax=Flagellimonas spongiicola TaxID=2942208 RepID=A0ABT0PR58_9FLAO|nr:hypothetical protein [Allomuricauda spongiicola]MCL6273844.1 hypothetical protein [Allomuricauda spongiicola]
METNHNYKNWKSRFEASRKAEKKKNIIIFCFTILIFTATYLWWIDELKFVGRRTALIPAVVKEEHMVHFVRSYYYQEATFEYEYQGDTFNASFDIWKNRFFVQVGDTLLLKIAVGNPSISELY